MPTTKMAATATKPAATIPTIDPVPKPSEVLASVLEAEGTAAPSVKLPAVTEGNGTEVMAGAVLEGRTCVGGVTTAWVVGGNVGVVTVGVVDVEMTVGRTGVRVAEFTGTWGTVLLGCTGC